MEEIYISQRISISLRNKMKVESDSDDNDGLSTLPNRGKKSIPMQVKREQRYPVRQQRIHQRYGDVMATD